MRCTHGIGVLAYFLPEMGCHRVVLWPYLGDLRVVRRGAHGLEGKEGERAGVDEVILAAVLAREAEELGNEDVAEEGQVGEEHLVVLHVDHERLRQVELAFIDVAAVVPHIQSGKLRALGVTSAQRFDGLPDVPTLNEAGVPGYEASGWLGLMAPAGTPPDVILTLNQAAAKALANPDLRLRLTNLAVTPDAGSSEQYRAFLQSEVEKWSRVLRAGNISLGN